jgi:hypothetical protein
MADLTRESLAARCVRFFVAAMAVALFDAGGVAHA